MKKIILILASCLFTLFGYSQVPSINVNTTSSKSRMTSSERKKIDSLHQIETILKSQFEKIKDDNSKENDKKIIEKELTNVNKEIKKIVDENYFYKANMAYYNEKINDVQIKIDKLKADMLVTKSDDNRNRIDKYEIEIEEHNNEIDKLILERDRKLNPETDHYKWIFPSRDKKYRNSFFEDVYNNSTNKTNFLNAFSVVGGSNGIIGQSEIVADNMGMFRVTFGTVISASNDSLTNANTQVEALQRLINGGGNFYFDMTAPLMTTIKGNNGADKLNFYAFANIKAASDVKGYGNDLTASTYNTSIGLNCYGDISSENNKFNFFFVAYTNYYTASTREFYQNLGINHNHGFLSGKVTIGVTMLNQFRFSANVLTFGSEEGVRSSKIGFGLQFLPNI